MIGTWDEPRLAQAFSNLISNAIQYGKPDGAIEISIGGCKTETDVKFSVSLPRLTPQRRDGDE